jgi:hypothetical protein
MDEQPWASGEFRAEVQHLVARIHDGDVETGATELWSTALKQAGRWTLAEALWNIWGGITDEFTHPRGDAAEGLRLSRECAAALEAVLGDEPGERRYSDDWVKRICGSVPPR